MIPRTQAIISRATDRPVASDWRRILADAVRDIGELTRLLELDRTDLDADPQQEFALLVPRGYIARMRKGDPQDPLLRQVLPTRSESAVTAGFVADPVAERALSDAGVIEKYAKRVLLVATAACPVHCRYCFRREYPYAEHNAAREAWQPALARLHSKPDVTEVILSGGDPLSLSTQKLAELVSKLAAFPQVQTLRLHTRFPVMIPERVDDELVELLSSTSLRTVVVVHTNHASEIDEAVAVGFRRLKHASDQLLNQSVLLRGVNDDAATLADLNERLFLTGVLPYYLHLLDPVAGAAHFDVPQGRALELAAELRRRLPGYLVPRLVREVPGELSKTWLA